MHKNFADWYAAVSLHRDAQTLEARWKAVETLGGRLKLAQVPSLVRVFFSLPSDDQLVDEIRTAARDEDKTYLSVGDANELAVLAGGVVAHVVARPSNIADAAALAVSCLDAQGLRHAARMQGVVDETMRYLANESIRERAIAESPVDDLNAAALNKQIAEKGGVPVTDLNTLWSAVDAVLKDILRKHAKHTESINLTLEKVLSRHQEESDILWWLFSEHSLDGTKAFHDLTIPEACFWGAKDLADLTRFLPGPFAAPALLHKMLRLVRNKVPAEVGISDAVNACNMEWKQKWVAALGANQVPDLFPMLFAVARSVEVGGGNEWSTAFEHATGLTAGARITPSKLALQIYNELLLRRAFSTEG